MPRRDPKPAKKPETPKPPAPPEPREIVKGQSFLEIVCPFCKADKPKVLRTKPREGARWYECRVCRMFDPGRNTVFKIPMKRGDA